MIVLKLQTTDFVLCVYCDRFQDAMSIASKRNKNIQTSTRYGFDGIETTKFELIDPNTLELVNVDYKTDLNPVFFENTDYYFDITFNTQLINNPVVRLSNSKSISLQNRVNKASDFLPISINYGNDIGNTVFCIDYQSEFQQKRVIIEYEIFPLKLDYKKDYLTIIKDINSEYSGLVLSYLKKSYHGLNIGNVLNDYIIWWQVFGCLFEQIVKSSKLIIAHPYRKLSKEVQYFKLDRIQKINPILEEEITRYKHISNKYYIIENKIRSLDNPENRFFKFVIFYIYSNFLKIKEMIYKKYPKQLTIQFKADIQNMETSLSILKQHHFFKQIGKPAHLRQESLVIHKASGYSQIFKSWIILEKGIDFLNGLKKIELKNIAELYQLWCFVQLKGIVKDLISDENITEEYYPPIKRGTFIFETDIHKKYIFTRDNNDKIELLHELNFNRQDPSPYKSYTLDQRPDIVLKITKNDLRDKYTFTYLFDAKYRIKESFSHNDFIDEPPDDAINQMHRYRDAIYFENREMNKPEKEIIGGYVLFPGTGNINEVSKCNFFTSIGKINIGAFPLKPNNNEINKLVKEHLSNLLKSSTNDILSGIIPHKECKYEKPNPQALIGIVSSEKHIEYFSSSQAVLYHTGEKKPSKFGYSDLKLFVPYFSGLGIKEYYDILDYRFIKRNEIYPPDHALFIEDDSTERLVLTLGKRHPLRGKSYYKLSSPIRTYNYTSLYNLRNPVNEKIKILGFD